MQTTEFKVLFEMFHSQRIGMIENILMILMPSNQRYEILYLFSLFHFNA